MKAQVAVEYLIIVTFAIMVLVPYILYLSDLSQRYSETNKLTIARNSVDKIGQTADWIYSLGEGAKTRIDVLVPEGIESIEFMNRTINWRVRTSVGISDVYYVAVTNVTGFIPTTPGYKNILVQAMRGGVNVSAG